MLSDKFLRAAIKRRLNEKVSFGSDNLESARAKATGDESEEKIDVGSVMPGFASSNEEEDEAAAGKINTSALGKNVANNPENESLKELAKFLGISSSVIDSQPKRRIIGSVIARYISLVNTNYADISKELFGDQADTKIRRVFVDGDFEKLFKDASEEIKKSYYFKVSTRDFFYKPESDTGPGAFKMKATERKDKYSKLSFLAQPMMFFSSVLDKKEEKKETKTGKRRDIVVFNDDDGSWDYKETYKNSLALYSDDFRKFKDYTSGYVRYWSIWETWRGTGFGFTNSNQTKAMSYVIYHMISNDTDDLFNTRMWNAYCCGIFLGREAFHLAKISGTFKGESIDFKGLTLFGVNQDKKFEKENLRLSDMSYDDFINATENTAYLEKVAATLKEDYASGLVSTFTKYMQKAEVEIHGKFQSMAIYLAVCKKDKGRLLEFFKKGAAPELIKEGKAIMEAEFDDELAVMIPGSSGVKPEKQKKNTDNEPEQEAIDAEEESTPQSKNKYELDSNYLGPDENKYHGKVVKTEKLLSELKSIVNENFFGFFGKKEEKKLTLNTEFHDDSDQLGWLFFYAEPGGDLVFDSTIDFSYQTSSTGWITPAKDTFGGPYDVIYCYEDRKASPWPAVIPINDKGKADKMLDLIHGLAFKIGTEFDFNRLYAMKRSQVRIIRDQLRPRAGVFEQVEGLAAFIPTMSNRAPTSHNDPDKVSLTNQRVFNRFFFDHDDLFEALSLKVVFDTIVTNAKENGKLFEKQAYVLYRQFIYDNRDKVKVGKQGKFFEDAVETSKDLRKPGELERIKSNKRIIDVVYTELMKLPEFNRPDYLQRLKSERDAAMADGKMDLSKDGLQNKHKLFQRAFTILVSKKISKKGIDASAFRVLTTDFESVAPMYTRIEGENSLDALMHLIDKITRMPDVPKRKRHGYESTRSVGTGELIRTSEFDTIYDTIKFINPNQVFPEACTPEMKEAGALFLDEMAKIFNESNIFKRRSGVLSKEIVIDYTYGPGGALSTPTITSPSASELRKDFGRSSINKFANALVTSLQAFQDTTNGGKLKPGDGITDNTTSKPPTSGGGFAITFPIAFYETKDQEDERLINEHNVVIELSDLIKKLY